MTGGLLSEQPKPTRQHYQILLMSWAGWVFDFYDLILYTFLLIPIRKEFHFSDLQLSYVLGASLAATALGGVFFGILADRIGRRAVLQWTILTYSLGTFLSGTASHLSLLVVFRILTGLGVGGEWATGQTFIGETFPPKVRGRYGAFMQTGAPVGIALASVVGGMISPLIGWRACFMLSVAPALLVVFIRRSLPESDLWLERRRLAREGALSAEPARAGRRHPILELLGPTHRRIFLLALVLAIFDMSAYWFTYSWMPGYLHDQRKLSLTHSALWILITQGGGFCGYSTFGFVADRFGRRPAYSFYSVIMAAGLVMITLLWNQIMVVPDLVLVCMFLVGFGTGMFGGYGPLFAELFPTHIRSTAMGAAFNLARGAQFFTPVAIAAIAMRYGMGGGISLAALFALLTGAWIWTLPETKGRQLTAA